MRNPRFPLLWLAVSLLIAIPSAHAEQEGDFTYSKDHRSVTITGYTGKGGAVTIPDSISGLPVRGLSLQGGIDVVTPIITSIILPDGIEDISIYGCSALRAIEVAESNSKYHSVDGVLFNKNQTELIRYPRGKSDKDYIIPDDVVTLGSAAFYGCANLINITVPVSTTSIYGFPVSFAGCFSLVGIEVAENNPKYRSVDGVLYNKNQTQLLRYPPGKPGNYVIADSISYLSRDCFYDCRELTRLTIGKN